jgi:hypothetical protein
MNWTVSDTAALHTLLRQSRRQFLTVNFFSLKCFIMIKPNFIELQHFIFTQIPDHNDFWPFSAILENLVHQVRYNF